ncbi:hypothetical protein [Halomonas sp. BM-2019]|uniref:hypothetical protein n=1 Tax=Halomonas sp. BM-2019 TaxID=2811227 RepID=UPI001B3C3100|nr:MAG: hypothetical protein J5F18_15470 [Halomonas sp. BM-2019]
MLEVLPKRFARYGLTLHPTKTRLVRFRPLPGQRAETFDFLGFTHYWGKSRQGKLIVKRKTAKGRLRRGLKRIALWCQRYRHLPVREQHRLLTNKVRGHNAYFGIRGNMRALQLFRREAEKIWIKWLCRRSQKASFSWDKANQLLALLPLPYARIVHQC